MKPVSPEDAKRRLKLRVAIKLMLYIGALGIAYVFFSVFTSGEREVRTVPSLRVSIGELADGQAMRLIWEGRPVLVYRRAGLDLANLRSADDQLADPQSTISTQPESFSKVFRSHTPEFFVAIALGTDLGCSVEYLPVGGEHFQDRPWTGGFIDSCSNSRYDLAGRVFKDQAANRNLVVPQYGIDGDTLILGR